MKLSIFTTATDPIARGDLYFEASKCYDELADECIEVGSDWPQEFDWSFIGEKFQEGYEACTGDWVIHADLDFIFHQKDFGAIRQALRDYPSSPGISFYKWQFIQPDRYNLKSRLVIAVNKKRFGNRIKFNGGGDLCQPTLDGKFLELSEMPQAGVPFYNYEKMAKTLPQVIDDVERMDRAYFNHFGRYLYSDNGENAFEGWFKMMSGRLQKPSKSIPLSDHPKYIQETIKNLSPEQFGYDGFGLLRRNNYVKGT